MQKTYYSWEQFDKDCERLASWARHFDFANVYGIPRGGLMIAVRLSHLLDIPLITDENDIDSHDTLVLDNMAFTDSKVHDMEERLGDLIIATLIWSDDSPEPDYYCRKKDGHIVFPWERRSDDFLERSFGKSFATSDKMKIRGTIRINKRGLA
ncbi:MAG: hypothetical protein ABH833_00230 [Parcubacteria group bacterium]